MVTQQDDNQFPVIIIGAGLAGLAAAAHLAERGLPPLLIEADALWPGGRLSGEEPTRIEHEGRTWEFRGDHGVHALWGGYANMRALLERFTDSQLQPSIGEEWINRWGRRVTMIEAGNAIR
ncbi:MAG: NAD(P)-binding protein, partial [Anaerolineae bacterium]|nr:NAD(P)-binding protein [Anaerolineae bacterium]